mgnify:CR=1 FL=1
MMDTKKIIMRSIRVLFYPFLSLLIIACGGCSSENGDQGTDPGSGTDTGKDQTSLIGKVLPDWEEGYLDIHAINTPRHTP